MLELSLSILDLMMRLAYESTLHAHAPSSSAALRAVAEKNLFLLTETCTIRWFSLFLWPSVNTAVITSVMNLLSILLCGFPPFADAFMKQSKAYCTDIVLKERFKSMAAQMAASPLRAQVSFGCSCSTPMLQRSTLECVAPAP